MKLNRLLLIILLILSTILVRANNEQPQGIDLNEYAFSIPVDQLNFSTGYPKFTLSFWVNINEFDDTENNISLLNIRNPAEGWPLSDYGWAWCTFVNADKYLKGFVRPRSSAYVTTGYIVDPIEFKTNQWKHFSFVFDYLSTRDLIVYVDGIATYKANSVDLGVFLSSDMIIMIGGASYDTAPLNAYIDKVQLYNKVLSESEVKESMSAPLLTDESLLGYWDFEKGCLADTEGFIVADNGSIKATMYKILKQEGDNYYYVDGSSVGLEIKPFTFAEGVNTESVLQGVEDNRAEVGNTKAYVSNGVLYIENAEGINSVGVYDTMGRSLTLNPSPVERGATNAQIELPSNLKGVILVKVNSEVVKVIAN